MRTVILTCTLLALSSCQPTPPPPRAAAFVHVLQNANDSSPIVVSDGAINIQHKKAGSHFRIHGLKHAALKLANHNVSVLGFNCDPSDTKTCRNSTCAPNNPTASICFLPVDPTDSGNPNSSWTLYLCTTANCSSGGYVATLTWDNVNNDLEKVELKTTDQFTLGGDDANGPLLSTGAMDLKSAQLVVTGPNAGTYTFNFSPTDKLKLSYVCYGSGNTCKQ